MPDPDGPHVNTPEDESPSGPDRMDLDGGTVGSDDAISNSESFGRTPEPDETSGAQKDGPPTPGAADSVDGEPHTDDH